MGKPFDNLVAIKDEVGETDFFTALIDTDMSMELYDVINTAFSSDTVDAKDAARKLRKGVHNDELLKVIPYLTQNLNNMRDASEAREEERRAMERRRQTWRDIMNAKGIKPEAPEDADLGAFAFPDWRAAELPPEPDTEVEKKLFSAINGHIASNSGVFDPEMAQVMKNAIDKGWYPGVFARPAVGSTIYRGMHVNQDWLKSALKTNFDVTSESGTYDGPMTFTPWYDQNATSWSFDESVAARFSRRLGEYRIIMRAQVTDDMLALDCRNLYRSIPKFREFSHEKEVMCFGPVKCDQVKWVNYSHI